VPTRKAPTLKIEPILRHYGAEHVPGERSGWRKMRCPFHDDTTASASVNNQYNSFKCHSCPVWGDAYQIVMQVEGVSFAQAKSIAQGIAETDDADIPRKSSRRELELF
jgi:DNA primase